MADEDRERKKCWAQSVSTVQTRSLAAGWQTKTERERSVGHRAFRQCRHDLWQLDGRRRQREKEVLGTERFDSADTISGSWMADEDRERKKCWAQSVSTVQTRSLAAGWQTKT